jgi:hypothetical protein
MTLLLQRPHNRGPITMPEANGSELRYAVRHLYTARQHKREARRRWHQVSAEAGACELAGEHYAPDELRGPCYERRNRAGEWCESCTVREPAHQEWREASTAAAAALRRVMVLGKHITLETQDA